MRTKPVWDREPIQYQVESEGCPWRSEFTAERVEECSACAPTKLNVAGVDMDLKKMVVKGIVSGLVAAVVIKPILRGFKNEDTKH